MQFKYAQLTIDKIPGKLATVNITFDWRIVEADYQEERWAQAKECTFTQDTLNTIYEKLAKEPKDEQTLNAIGDQIWRLFPLDITDQFRKFDAFAEEVYKRSKSLVPLIILTDYLTIPWELCITRRPKATERVPWYKRFLVATQICGLSRPDEKTSETERKRVGIVLTPFPLTGEKEEGLSDEYNNLLEVMKYLERQYQVRISLYQCPEQLDELYKIEDALAQGPHDLLIYVGSRAGQRITLYNPTTNKPEYFEMRDISSGSNTERAIFLDACSTALKKRDGTFVSEEPKEFLGRNTAYIGTIADIRMTPAIVFANYFLKSLFTRGASLAEALYEARKQADVYLGKRYPEREEYRIHSRLFSLYGRNDNILLNSFRYQRKRISFIYPKMVDLFISEFRSSIYPSSLPVVSLKKKDTLKDVVANIERLDGNFIADLSIAHATNLITRYRGDPDKELVIIGGIFRLLPEASDSTLYFWGDLSDYHFFYSLDPLTTVTIMAITYFIDRGEVGSKFVSKGGHRKMNYPEIYSNALNAIQHGAAFEPFTLIGSYRKQFEEALEKMDPEVQINRIPLYPEFLDIVQSKYSEYSFSQNLPAEVLVARRKDVEKDVMLYREIFTRWKHWARESQEEILPSQEVFISLTAGDRDSLLKFTRFIAEKLTKYLNIEGALEESDFCTIEEWGERVSMETNYVVDAEVEKFLEENDAKIERLGRKFSKYEHSEGQSVDAVAVKRWLQQFETVERVRWALILLENVEFIDRNRMKEMFVHYYTKVLPQEERDRVIVTNLGGPYDSSYLVSYFLGDMWGADLEVKSAGLRSILDNEDPKEKVILFVDDIIGSGKQAKNIFHTLLGIEDVELRERHETKLTERQIEKLKTFKCRLFTFIGFQEGKSGWVQEMRRLGLNVEEPYSFQKEEEQVGCFHPARSVFDTPKDREGAQAMCSEIGYELFLDKRLWDEEKRKQRSLGYGNSQKLTVFFYNVPTSTLPILWKRGTYRGRKWGPLFLRREKKGI